MNFVSFRLKTIIIDKEEWVVCSLTKRKSRFNIKKQ